MDHFKASSSLGDCSSPSSGNDEENMGDDDLRRGPWTVEEDLTLMNYIARHGEGRWNSLASSAGLKRTGKSCRLRWLNYLRPDVRRGNISLEEQLLILELHSQLGNRWSKIAQYLPGRTDNEIKNYWRTRVQKQAKQLNCDVNSKQFKDTVRHLWMPRLVERIQAATIATGSPATATPSSEMPSNYHSSDPQNYHNIDIGVVNQLLTFPSRPDMDNFTNSSTAGSTDWFSGTHEVSPMSNLHDCYNYPHINHSSKIQDYYQLNEFPGYGSFNQGFDCQVIDQNNQWIDDAGNVSDCLWNTDDPLYSQQQLDSDII